MVIRNRREVEKESILHSTCKTWKREKKGYDKSKEKNDLWKKFKDTFIFAGIIR